VESSNSNMAVGEDFWNMITMSPENKLSDWFAADRVKSKRDELRNLLLKMADEWKLKKKDEEKTNRMESHKSDEIILVHHLEKKSRTR